MINKFYCYCTICSFSAIAKSVNDAKEKIEAHEKEFHKGKQVGIFGKAKEYPEFIKISVDI